MRLLLGNSALCALMLALLASGCALKAGPGPAARDHSWTEQGWGVVVEGVRLSAGGYMCDFRFRVIDADKAAPLVDRRISAYLIDETSGARTFVPAPPKVGPLRQSVRYGKPIEGRTYFILFANPGRLVKRGSSVGVNIGDFVLSGLVVQ